MPLSQIPVVPFTTGGNNVYAWYSDFMKLDISETIRQAVEVIKSGKAKKGDSSELELHARFLEARFNPRIHSVSSIVVAPHDNGFFANFLQVLDVIALKSTSASVFVDWSPIEGAAHFSYHTEGNLWDQLFYQPGSKPEQPDVEIRTRLNPLLANVYKGIYWDLPIFQNDRKIYHKAFSQIKIRNERINKVLARHAALFESKHVIGVHKRVSNPGTEAMQQGQIPSTESCIEKLQDYINHLKTDYIVYLATDDLESAARLKSHFKGKLLLIEDATRVNGGIQSNGTDSEVHRMRGGASIKDAEDVVIDTWSLGKADCLWHVNSSNIPLAASFINPDMRLHSLV